MGAAAAPAVGGKENFKTVLLAGRGIKHFINSLKVQNKTQIPLQQLILVI